ncbi:MAG: FAD-dependent oxidoreductase [Thermoleophilia bacterium]
MGTQRVAEGADGPTDRCIRADVLVVGGGMAGCFAAIKACEAGASVVLVDKGYAGRSGQTPYAGSFAVFNADWGHDLDAWMEQAARYGEHVNHREWTELCFRESFQRYEDLVSWGVEFERDASGELISRRMTFGPCESLHLEPRKPAELLRGQVLRSGARIIDRAMVVELLKQDDAVVGAVAFGLDAEEVVFFETSAVVLAAGAGGFKGTGWPLSALTSDADCMAYRAGAEITGKEFTDPHASQVDPVVYPMFGRLGREPGGGRPLRGPVFDAEGVEIPGRGTLFLDLDFAAHEGRAPFHMTVGDKRYQVVGGAAAGMSVHKAEGLWPAATDCSTNVPGLYAAGDCLGTMQTGSVYSSIGLSLMGCAVTGARAGSAAAARAAAAETPGGIGGADEIEAAIRAPLLRAGGFSPRWVTQVLQNAVVPYFVLYVKHADRLRAALTTVEFLRDHAVPKLFAHDAHGLRLAHETRNMVLNAEMRLRASLFRTESRGCHYREDYPRRDDPDWLAWVLLKDEGGSMEVFKRPVPEEWWPDLSVASEERYPFRLPGESLPSVDARAS